jgi:hypothetical protein
LSALRALFDATYWPRRRAAEIKSETKAVHDAAVVLIDALNQNGDYFMLPSGELWTEFDIEATLGKHLRGKELKSAETSLRDNSPGVIEIMERIAKRAAEELTRPTKAPRTGRGTANVTHFRELVLTALIKQLGTGRGRAVVRQGQRVLGEGVTQDIVTIAHGLTLAAFPEAPKSAAATRMALLRLLSART